MLNKLYKRIYFVKVLFYRLFEFLLSLAIISIFVSVYYLIYFKIYNGKRHIPQRDNIAIEQYKGNYSIPCKFNCNYIEWMSWSNVKNGEFRGSSKRGSISLINDKNTGYQHQYLNTIELLSNIYFPKNINSIPTPWMPGTNNVKKLIHTIKLDSLKTNEGLVLLLGEFPNSLLYSSYQYGKLRAFDKFNRQLSLTNVCEVFQDPMSNGVFSPIIIQNSGIEMQFLVNSSSRNDGGVVVLGNLPDSTVRLEIEHNNELSSRDDGIYISAGFSFCCNSTVTNVDTVVCENISINGKLITQTCSFSDTVNLGPCDSITNYSISVIKNDAFNLGTDTIICDGSIFKIKSISNLTKWSNGSVGDKFFIFQSGIYWGEVSTMCGTYRDSITVLYISVPIINLGPDKIFCPGLIDTIWAHDSNTKWSDGSIGPYLLIYGEGIYFGSIMNECYIVSDTIQVSSYDEFELDLGPDIISCEGNIDTVYSLYKLKWNNGIENNYIIVSEPGIYWGTIITPCGILTDSVQISKLSKVAKPYLAKDTIICYNDTFALRVNVNNAIWNNINVDSISVNKPGIYKYFYNDLCQSFSDSICIKYDSIPRKFSQNVILVCDANTFILESGINTAHWSNGYVGKSIQIEKSGKYSYLVNNSCGLFIDEVNVEFRDAFEIYLPNIFSPNNDNYNDVFPQYSLTFPFRLEIYSRWGELLFKGVNQYWDGKFLNKTVSPGVYVYILIRDDCGGVFKSGTVTFAK